MPYREHSHWVEYVVGPPPEPPRARTLYPDATPRPPMLASRARLSQDTEAATFNALLGASLAGAVAPDDTWRGLDLDARTLERMSPRRLLELLADLSPEVSKALWDFLTFGNAGWDAVASRPSGAVAGSGPHQAALDAFLARLAERNGAVNVVIERLLLGAFLRGGYFAELVIGADGRTPVDLATPDPASARFRKVADPETGWRWQIGQWQAGQWVALDRPTIRYIPIHPFPASPDGRAPASPAIFSSLFLLAMLHDLRRVVQQQGWPRIDLSVDLARLKESMPDGAADDPAEFAAWVNATISEIASAYSRLEPDDAYIHADVVSVNRPVGAVDSSALGAIGGIITALERMLTRALKSVPILQGVTDGVSEANVRIQWRLYQATLRSFQQTLEALLSDMLTLALEAQGVSGVVQFRFAQADLLDRLIDVQTESMQIQNARAQYDNGWIGQNEAARRGAGVDRADQEMPRTAAQGIAPQAGANT